MVGFIPAGRECSDVDVDPVVVESEAVFFWEFLGQVVIEGSGRYVGRLDVGGFGVDV